jgi:hypothetical protein
MGLFAWNVFSADNVSEMNLLLPFIVIQLIHGLLNYVLFSAKQIQS